jgi:hypothetical protein
MKVSLGAICRANVAALSALPITASAPAASFFSDPGRTSARTMCPRRRSSGMT